MAFARGIGAINQTSGNELFEPGGQRVSQLRSHGTVVNLRAYVDPVVVPTLVLVDLQEEYVSTSRGLALPNSAAALAKCRATLSHARKMGFPVAFVRWAGRSPFFNPATRFARWITGLEPNGSDMIFERDRPSCYASQLFAEVMLHGGGANMVLAGFTGAVACLSTAIDAFHRGHRLTYLTDASASHALSNFSAADVHGLVAELASLYCQVQNADDWIAATARQQHAQRGGL
jgi:nicotinamidase-related amidase